MKKVRRLIIVTFLFSLVLFVPSKAFALETGYLPATSCITDGSSCSAMNTQDTNYNSWTNKTYSEVKTTFSGFGVPDEAVIDDIQIKMRIKTSSSGWTWFVHASDDNGITYFTPRSCNFHGVCSYNTSTVFNQINVIYPTMSWLNNNPAHVIKGSDINSGNFSLKLWQSQGTKSTDIDVLFFNIRYHMGPDAALPPNVYEMARGFVAAPVQTPGIGQVFYHWDFTIPYTSGKVVLSSTPDGMGPLEFSDSLTLVNTSFNSALFTYNAAPFCVLQHAIPPVDITSSFSPLLTQGTNRGYIRLGDLCGGSKNIGSIYLVILPNPTPTPTGIPTPTSIPAPTPFLDLPWDYKGKGLSFSEAALAINSYFDHEYPLLSGGLTEEIGNDNIVSFKSSMRVGDPYPYHDGYDYGSPANVHMGDPVLAAAAGMATYINSCGACGNMIIIDHGNGYQTRYLHMLKDGLIIDVPGVSVPVSAHQEIGKVGSTGRSDGAHIHFSVFQDKDHNGSFEDNIPDGVTDPFGWQGTDPDPWEIYSFSYGGVQRTGNKSYYLWKNSLGEKTEILAPSGGNFTSEKFSISFPQGSTIQNLLLKFSPEPILSPSAVLSSLGTSLGITATDPLGNLVSTFQLPFTLSADFSKIDLTRYDSSTISFYSSNDGINWTKEVTSVDLNTKSASTTLSHFTHFALMAERIDTIAPTTSGFIQGSGVTDGWYTSPASVSLVATDNNGGLGVDYILYKTNGGDWEEYKNPISFTEEKTHTFSFYSVDRDENIEEVKTIDIRIDNTPPILTWNITAGEDTYIPGRWTNKDILVTFSCTDTLSGVDFVTDPITFSEDGRNQSSTGECRDKAGNSVEKTIENINIDKTPPQITLEAYPAILWPPNGKLVDVTISGLIDEENLLSKKIHIEDEYNQTEPVLEDFGVIQLEAKRKGSDFDGRVYIIKVEAVDNAGNSAEKEIPVTVLHDEGNN